MTTMRARAVRATLCRKNANMIFTILWHERRASIGQLEQRLFGTRFCRLPLRHLRVQFVPLQPIPFQIVGDPGRRVGVVLRTKRRAK